MNNPIFLKRILFRAWLAAVLSAVVFSPSLLRAQTTQPGRVLFIFDSSWSMKKREAAVELAVKTLLATSMGGQLHKGDQLGAWSFNQTLYPGDFPLQEWIPENAVSIATNLTYFVRTRRYEKETNFETLQPLLNRVVQNSERLTVLIFSDGLTKISGTTFDNGINQLFAANSAVQKKARQPFVVALRAQQGKYVGCTVSYPPEQVSLPQFPPLPPPPVVPKPAPVVAPVVAPAAIVPSLLITGTKVETPVPVVSNPPVVIQTPPPAPVAVLPTVAAPVSAPVAPSNPPAAVPVSIPVAPTNPPAAPTASVVEPSNPPASVSPAVVVATANLTPTNAPPVALTNVLADAKSESSGKKNLLIIALVLLAAGLATALIVVYFRRPDKRSLISRSMNDR
jgi:hypothetical protein